uniref:Macaca fascicularis brain cDNA clone: QmoA-10230, similar to human mannosidase, alpha, class 2A, member 1 (MAN2A1), mRNA, RefSeq: NM_002372.1 n=1 Tax=Macaca fascicularis TaxID=9541 RepID=I7GJ07_MACFA|nr:unnamed protein product [Macaca fascicularis]
MQNMLLMTIAGFLFPSKDSLYVQACICVYLIHPFFHKRELIYVCLITYVCIFTPPFFPQKRISTYCFIPSHTDFHRI